MSERAMVMPFNEELLSDERFAQFSERHQSVIIAKHCADIEVRIRTAPSRIEAERMSKAACLQFEQECSSILVRHALLQRVYEIIANYWNHQ